MNSGMSTIVMFVVLIGIMYFMMIRPQKKQQDAHQKMLSSLKHGDEVITIGGLHAVVDSVNDEKNIITLDCDGVLLDFSKSSIARVTQKQEDPIKETAAAPKETASETKTADEAKETASDSEQKED
ncbi:protein translocase subunit yajC [Ligilactobacillus sp. WC1T17]|uniref:Protein translocase subunit yajC n=1 Tax=Ligilactobacillus ruminis TaxID=1623 RepID=A0ABY1AAJ0_9LACO|nr:protein translocase subunit yajC [Ligilactobacillus ruminis]